MAEPIGIASGLLALSVFAFRSSVSLYQAVDSFQSNQRIMRELKEELEALERVLQSLQQAVADNSADPYSFRDWAKVKYLGDDIAGFKNMLAGYKSTISIALGDANFRKTAVTANVLQEYKEMVTNTTSDLEEHLREIEKRLQTLFLPGVRISNEDAAERERILEEKDSTRQCLIICAQVSKHINQVQPNAFEDFSAAEDTHQIIVSALGGSTSAKRATTTTLKECKQMLTDTTSELEDHVRKIGNRLETPSLPKSMILAIDAAERERVEEQKKSIEQCLSICAQAPEQVDKVPTNVFEDVSSAQDAHQVIVSTLGDLISAKRVTAGLRATQWLGTMNDTSLQQLSQERGAADRAALEKTIKQQSAMVAKFEEQYGAGYRLSGNERQLGYA